MREPPEVVELAGLQSDSEKANKVADGIEKLTAEYEKLNLEEKLETFAGGNCREITLKEIIKTFSEIKLPKGFHSGDPPRELIRDASAELALPLSIIFNSVTSTTTWPEAYKDEQTKMIPKKESVEVLKDLRPIVLTPFFGKVLERILRKDILEDVLQNLHPAQFGGLKGLSTDHYLCSLYQKIAIASESNYIKKGITSILVTYDFTSAYNAMSHDEIVSSAARLGLRNELVRILASYLHERRTTVIWEEEMSSPRHANGGAGQGTVFSSTLFIMTVDRLLVRLTRLIAILEQHLGAEIRTSVFMFADDLCVLFHAQYQDLPVDSTGNKYFEDVDSRLSKYMQEILNFTYESGMKLNLLKTKAITYNFNSPRISFPPDCIKFPDGTPVEICSKLRLLGSQLGQDFSMDPLVADRRRAGFYATWKLRRLQQHGVKHNYIKKAYLSYVRSKLESGLLPASSLLGIVQWQQLESVQRRGTRVVLGHPPRSFAGDEAPGYTARLRELGIERIKDRTKKRFENFIERNEFEKRFSAYYGLTGSLPYSLKNPRDYVVPRGRTRRVQRAPFTAAAEHLNKLQSTRDQRRKKFFKIATV